MTDTEGTSPVAEPQTPADSTPQDNGVPEGRGFTLETLPGWIVPAILLGVPALIAVLSLIWPEVFFDRFVEKYYWGPIKGDTGYNLVNTLSWAVLGGLCLVGLTQMLARLKVTMNNVFILGATAWVLNGAIFRVMEDTGMFRAPLQYVMITPPIYLLFALFGILSLFVGLHIEHVARVQGTEPALRRLWAVQAALVLLYTLMWVADWSQITVYLNPIHVALFAAIGHFVARWWIQRTGRVDARDLLLILALPTFLMTMDYIVQFLVDPWAPRGNAITHSFVTAPLLAGALVGLVWATARAAAAAEDARRKATYVQAGFAFAFVALLWYATGASTTVGAIGGLLVVGLVATGIGVLLARRMRAGSKDGAPTPTMLAYLVPINLVLVGSQLIDGFATSMGLDLAGYREKHILSAFLIDAFRNFSEAIGWEFGAQYPSFLAFVPVKLAVSLAVVYAIEVYSAEDVKKHPALIGFVKFFIIMVGIGPGVRDFVRLSLGV